MEKKKTHKICAYLMAAVLALTSFTGCTKLEDGIYSDGTKMDTVPATDTAPSDASAVTQTPVQTQDTQTDQSTAVTEDTAETTDIDDVVEPVVTGTSWDYSTLSTEGDGYGQGTHFDELNRPRGALRFNEGYSKYNAKAIEDTEEKVITLTFDQGYENGYTASILDTLKEKGVKATFFVVADYAERQPELVQRMIDEGHAIGNHSWHHYSMPELSVEEAQQEIMELHEYMLTNFGVCMNLFRPPKGEYSEQSLAITGDLGYTTVLWSFAYADWDTDNQPDPEESLNKLIERAHPGAIYLLHSVSETNSIILGDFIDAMLAQGYTFK